MRAQTLERSDLDSIAGAPGMGGAAEKVDPLVERARNGDVAAFEALYRTHAARVLALCLRMSGDRARAEELTQEAFVRAWRKLGSFRGASAFSSWLYRLTVNVVLSERRGRRGQRMSDADPELLLDVAASGSHPHLAVDLERAITKLPDGARRIFVLHDIEGFKHEEIAAMTGVAVGTSKAQLHRARRLLREVLQ